MPGRRTIDRRIERLERAYESSRLHRELIASAYDLLVPGVAHPDDAVRRPVPPPGPRREGGVVRSTAIGARPR